MDVSSQEGRIKVRNLLILIRLVHLVIFFFMWACLLFILYAALAREFGWALVIAMGSIMAEAVALSLNRWKCPITTLAEKFGVGSGSVSDIFLPKWYASKAFIYSGIIFVSEIILLGFRYFSGV